MDFKPARLREDQLILTQMLAITNPAETTVCILTKKDHGSR